MSASLLPRAPGQSGALGLGLGVGCGLAAQVKGGSLPQIPDGAWKGLHLSCCHGCGSEESQSPHPLIKAGPGNEGVCRKSTRTDRGARTISEA